MPTIQEFIAIDPGTYGVGNVNLLVSSSENALQIPQPPFYIQGLTIPRVSKNSKSIGSALLQVDTIKFTFDDGIKEAPVINRQSFPDYVYLEIQPLLSQTIPSSINPTGSIAQRTDEEFIFDPFFQSNFFTDDYNVLLNNNERTRRNSVRQIVDRNTSQIEPTNIDLIISQSATFAEVQDSNYTQRSRTQGRYIGSNLNNKGIVGQEPAVQLTQFIGSLHPLTSKTSGTGSIKLLDPADRVEKNLFFTSYISGSGLNQKPAEFPKSGSFVYIEVENSNRFEKVTSKFIYSIENNLIYTVNETGGVTLIQ